MNPITISKEFEEIEFDGKQIWKESSSLTDLFQSSIKGSDFFASEIGAMTYFIQTETQTNLFIFLTVAGFRDIGSAAKIHVGEIQDTRLIASAVAETGHDSTGVASPVYYNITHT